MEKPKNKILRGGIWTWIVSIDDQHATTVATEDYA